MNALADTCWRRRPHRETELRVGIDAFDATEIRPRDKVVVIGAFVPFLRALKRRQQPFLVLEQDPATLKADELPFFRPAEEAGKVVPEADVLLVTGTTLINDTLEALLEFAKPTARVTMVGPTVSLLPDAFCAVAPIFSAPCASPSPTIFSRYWARADPAITSSAVRRKRSCWFGARPVAPKSLTEREAWPTRAGAGLRRGGANPGSERMTDTYAGYLGLQQLLSAQTLRTGSDDELLFIIIHQQHELWFKLAIHELDCAISSLMRQQAHEADCIIAFKRLSRVSAIQQVLISSWDVLGTLTPDEFFVFRETVGRGGASGFQSAQYRVLEYKLGLKYRFVDFELPNGQTQTVDVFENAQTETERAALHAALAAPGIYDAVISFMARALPVFDIADTRSADFSRKHRKNSAVFKAWSHVYRNRMSAPELYQLGEKLIDLEDAFRKWRFAHLATVSRVIGSNAGTGGSSGLRYLKQVANQLFEDPMYPELWDVRSEMFSRAQGVRPRRRRVCRSGAWLDRLGQRSASFETAASRPSSG